MALVILGGASSGIMVAEAAVASGIEVRGFLNDRLEPGVLVGGYPVLAGFDDWADLPDDVRLIAAFPLPGSARQIFDRLQSLAIPAERRQTVIHPTAVVSERATLAAGCFIGPHAVVEHGADLGADCIVRGGAYVSHDVRLGPSCFVGANATVLGRCSLGVGAHIGPGSVCREGRTIGDFAMVGVGAVVVRDVAAEVTVAGNPAKPLPS